MSSVLGHVIGTVALLAMLFTIVPFITTFGVIMVRSIVRHQLIQVASLVSSKVLEAYRLAQRSNVDKMLFALRLDIPEYVTSTGYYIELFKDSEGFKVKVTSEKSPHVYAEVVIPISPHVDNVIFKTAEDTIQLNSMMIIRVSKLHSGVKYPVIWCMKDGNFIYLGLGILKRT